MGYVQATKIPDMTSTFIKGYKFNEEYRNHATRKSYLCSGKIEERCDLVREGPTPNLLHPNFCNIVFTT